MKHLIPNIKEYVLKTKTVRDIFAMKYDLNHNLNGSFDSNLFNYMNFVTTSINYD